MNCFVTILRKITKSRLNKIIVNGALLHRLTKDDIICYMKNDTLSQYYEKYIKKYYKILYFDEINKNLLELKYDNVCYFNNVLLNNNVIDIFNKPNIYVNKNLFVFNPENKYITVDDTFTKQEKTYRKDTELVKFFIPKLNKRFAVVTLLMLGDNYLPGIITMAYSIQLANPEFRKEIDLVCLVTPDISQKAINDIMKYYDKVIKVDYIEIPYENIRHSKLHIQKVYAKTFTKLHVFSLVQYEKVIMIDADMLVLKPEFFSLFSLDTPAGVFIGCLSPYKDEKTMNLYIYIYGEDLKHGRLIEKRLYDIDCYDLYRKHNIIKNTYLGVETSICLLKPNIDDYHNLKKLLFNSNEKTYKGDTDLIAKYYKYKWHHIDIKFLGRWVDPNENKDIIVLDLYGTEGKPWAVAKYTDYKDSNYWLDRYKEYYKESFENNCEHNLIHDLYSKLNLSNNNLHQVA